MADMYTIVDCNGKLIGQSAPQGIDDTVSSILAPHPHDPGLEG